MGYYEIWWIYGIVRDLVCINGYLMDIKQHTNPNLTIKNVDITFGIEWDIAMGIWSVV